MRKAAERTARQKTAGAASGLAGNRRIPPLSGPNPARRLPLPANEVVKESSKPYFSESLTIRVEPRVDTSLAVEILQGIFNLSFCYRKG